MGWGSGIAVSCGVGRKHGSDPMFLWPWRRPAAAAPIQPVAWKLPYATDSALKRPKKKEKKKKKSLLTENLFFGFWFFVFFAQETHPFSEILSK